MQKKRRMPLIAVFLSAVLFAGGCKAKTPESNMILQPQVAAAPEATAAPVTEAREPDAEGIDAEEIQVPDWIDVQLIPIHGEARRGVKLEGVNNIVLHYVGNPGTSAQNNRDYFAGSQSQVSAHFIVGLKGEIIQCVPLDEKSSASNYRNADTISIETCHPDETGKYTKETYDAEVKLVTWLCDVYGLTEQDVIRHYDVTGKNCPKYFVENEDAWKQFLEDVKEAIQENKKDTAV